MYVRSNGMGAYRRGLGLNCPGDPGCSDPANWQQPEPGSTQGQINSLWDYIAGISSSTAVPVSVPASSGSSITTWVNQNAGKIGIAAAVLLFWGMAVKR